MKLSLRGFLVSTILLHCAIICAVHMYFIDNLCIFLAAHIYSIFILDNSMVFVFRPYVSLDSIFGTGYERDCRKFGSLKGWGNHIIGMVSKPWPWSRTHPYTSFFTHCNGRLYIFRSSSPQLIHTHPYLTVLRLSYVWLFGQSFGYVLDMIRYLFGYV